MYDEYNLRHMGRWEMDMGRIFLVQTNLTFRILVRAHGVSCFCHRLLDDADRVRRLRSRIHALLGDQSGDFTSDGRDIMLSFLFADLNLTFTEDLKKTNRLSLR
jgi:hypothetical protein